MLAAIALGSNLTSRFGEPAANLEAAIVRLRELGEVGAVSRFCVTEPVGYLDQPRFTNAAAILETALAPVALLHGLLAIEQAMGRDRSQALLKGPRVIDLDLLLCLDDDGSPLTVTQPDLILPHPEMHLRRFVLEPLAEVAPAWLHPGLGWTVGAMLAALPGG